MEGPNLELLNDQLLADESAGELSICRAPAFVGCVVCSQCMWL